MPHCASFTGRINLQSFFIRILLYIRNVGISPMKRRLLTCSKIDTAIQCQYYLREDVPWSDASMFPDATDFGSHCHAVFEAYVKKDKAAADAVLATWPSLESMKDEDATARLDKVSVAFDNFMSWWTTFNNQLFGGIDNDVGEGNSTSVEVAYAYNPFTGLARRLVGQEKRDYAGVDPNTEVAGTADLVYTEGDTCTVVDYKTGYTPPEPTSSQLIAISAAEQALSGLPNNKTAILHINDVANAYKEYTVTPFDVLELQEKLRWLLTMDLSQAVPNPGTYCVFCPARQACPAFSAKKQVAPHETYKLDTFLPTPEYNAWILSAIPIAREYLDQLENALKLMADDQRGLDLPDAKLYKGTDNIREYPKLSDVAVEFLRENGCGAAITHNYRTSWHTLRLMLGSEKYEKVKSVLTDMGCVLKKNVRIYRTVNKKEKKK